jgi:hypothetical protein
VHVRLIKVVGGASADVQSVKDKLSKVYSKESSRGMALANEKYRHFVVAQGWCLR